MVVRLLIRRPECFGPALRGEGGAGLLAAMEDAIKISEDPARDGPTPKKDRRFMYGFLNFFTLFLVYSFHPTNCNSFHSVNGLGLVERSSRRRTGCILGMPSCHSTRR